MNKLTKTPMTRRQKLLLGLAALLTAGLPTAAWAANKLTGCCGCPFC